MAKIINKKLLLVLTIFASLILSVNYQFVKADSGWDSGYSSSGSSSSSSSSWSSSSSSSGTHNSTDEMTDLELFAGYIIISILQYAFVFFMWLTIINTKYHKNYLDSICSKICIFILLKSLYLLLIFQLIEPRKYFWIDFSIIFISAVPGTLIQNKIEYSLPKKIKAHEIPEEKLKAIDPSLDKELLKEEAFTIYKNIQESWMNFDYNNLRKYTTDELFNMYESQLKVLKIKNQKNIMKNIEAKSIKITDINIENNIEKVSINLVVEQYDYVVDKDNKIVRGTDKFKNNVEYIITLTRSMQNDKVDKCPNCGAAVDIVSGGICPYCDSTIVNNTNKFIMSKKECINQRRV